jgi:gamma-glutamylcyclotransferase (GGCT)/AIG2-like uncharacterized protein YtfP
MTSRPNTGVVCHRLFVYGTLRRGLRLHHHLARLGASFELEAKVAGELFDLGSYPGARPASGKGKWVLGELFLLRHVENDLKHLDRVEDFNPAAPERSEFVRAVADVVLPDGTRESAWIYWLSEQAQVGRQIACGDYAAWQARTEVNGVSSSGGGGEG